MICHQSLIHVICHQFQSYATNRSFMHTHTHMRTHTPHTCAHTLGNTHTHIYTYVHTHIYTYTHNTRAISIMYHKSLMYAHTHTDAHTL